MDKKLIEKNTILRVLVGSQAYGISSGDEPCKEVSVLSRICEKGTPCCEVYHKSSDRDEKGVLIEPFESFVGFSGFEQYEHRTAVERTGRKDEPSGPGDTDTVIYGLQKFLRLALKGNPSIIEMLFVRSYLKGTCAIGAQLQELYPYIVSRKVGNAYLGYMQAQKRKLQEKESVPGSERASLVEKYGFDTKYAGHLLRLGMQGVELLTEGKLVLPMTRVDQTLIKSVRAGDLPLEMVLESASELEGQLKYLLDHSEVREEPDTSFVEDWMVKTYWDYWKAQRFMLDLPINSSVH